jgi:hypothetical protein
MQGIEKFSLPEPKHFVLLETSVFNVFPDSAAQHGL